MLKRFTYALLALTFVFASCSKDESSSGSGTGLSGPYASGIVMYGTTYEGLAFYDPAKKEFYEGNLFEEANGETVGTTESFKGGINDVWVEGERAYFLTPASVDGSGRARVAVTKADTYELITDIYAIGFGRATLGDIYSLVPVGRNKIYVMYNKTSNHSGVGILRYNEDGETSFTADIEGTYGLLGVGGPATFQKFVKYGKYVVIPCGSRIQFIDVNTDAVDAGKTVEIDPDRQVSAVVRGRDGYLYAIVAGACGKEGNWFWGSIVYTSNSSIVKIDPATSQIVSSVDVVVDGQQLNVKAAMEANGAVASLVSDEIFFVVDGEAFGQASVYKYDCRTNEISFFANPVNSNEYTFGKSMATDYHGNLYVPKIQYYSVCYPQVYSITSGALVKDFEEDDEYVSGDGGFVSTYLFR